MNDFGKIVVVDDKADEGTKIIEAIWRAGLPALFAHYDTSVWSDTSHNPYKGMTGVRVVFMDIDLLGGGMKGSESLLFGTVETALETLLDKDNGPYALVTWTSFSSSAEDLVAHLKQRLSHEKKPLVFQHLSKEDFASLPPDELLATVRSLFSKRTAVQAVAAWEVCVRHAAAGIAAEMLAAARQVSGEEDGDAALAGILFKLVKATSGQDIEPGGFTGHLLTAMIPLLADRLGQSKPEALELLEPPAKAGTTWMRRINSMLHLDTRTAGTGPGLILNYPEGESFRTLPFRESKQELGVFLMKEVINGGNRIKKEKRSQAQSDIRPVLMDITPPCDHAWRKVRWRRFIVGAIVPEQWWEYIYLQDRRTPLEASRVSDNLWKSPEMLVGDTPAVIVFNGRLIASLPDEEYQKDRQHLSIFGRMREQIFGTFLSWLGSHITRVGIVELRE